MDTLYGAVDVHYPETGGAYAAVVVAAEPTFGALTLERVAYLPAVAAYQPGSFFIRELPAIQAALALTPFDTGLGLLIVDGYVDLDPDGRPGLGAHVRVATDLVVIGVAKTAFRTATHAIPVLRGSSQKPLFVTAAGIDPAEAAELVRQMAGTHRMPDALHRVDRLARASQAIPST